MSVYESIVQGLNEAIEYKKGNITAKTITLSAPAPVPDMESTEIKNIRNSLNMSQKMFADVLGVSNLTE